MTARHRVPEPAPTDVPQAAHESIARIREQQPGRAPGGGAFDSARDEQAAGAVAAVSGVARG